MIRLTWLVLFFAIVDERVYCESSNCSFLQVVQKRFEEGEMGDADYFGFNVINSDDQIVHSYNADEVYTIVLNSSESFQRFYIKAEVINSERTVQLYSTNTVEFVSYNKWKNEDFKRLQCHNVSDAVISEVDNKKKIAVRARWMTKSNKYPIRFFVAVLENEQSDWFYFAPKGGYLAPSNSKAKIHTLPPTSKVTTTPTSLTSVMISFDKLKIMRKKKPETKIKFSTEPFDYCAQAPCFNKGYCNSIPQNYTFECYCTNEWIDDRCATKNVCLRNPCKNFGTCVASVEGDFNCNCLPGFGGKLCEVNCQPHCKNAATCSINLDKSFSCICLTGWEGKKCNMSVGTSKGACPTNPCLNGATCVVDGDSTNCLCKRGYMGKTCHRPCQDVLLGCYKYQQAGHCNSSNPVKRQHYLNNCAATCEMCESDISTIKTIETIPLALESLSPLIGTWTFMSKSGKRYPVDIPAMEYLEKLEIVRPTVLPFDPSSLSFTSTIVSSSHNGSDTIISHGFIFVNTSSDPGSTSPKVSITVIDSNGLVIVEEGELTDERKMSLVGHWFYIPTALISTVHPKIRRSFTWTDSTIVVKMNRIMLNGVADFAELTYIKEDHESIYD